MYPGRTVLIESVHAPRCAKHAERSPWCAASCGTSWLWAIKRKRRARPTPPGLSGQAHSKRSVSEQSSSRHRAYSQAPGRGDLVRGRVAVTYLDVPARRSFSWRLRSSRNELAARRPVRSSGWGDAESGRCHDRSICGAGTRPRIRQQQLGEQTARSPSVTDPWHSVQTPGRRLPRRSVHKDVTPYRVLRILFLGSPRKNTSAAVIHRQKNLPSAAERADRTSAGTVGRDSNITSRTGRCALDAESASCRRATGTHRRVLKLCAKGRGKRLQE